jgi:hypothetical protein
VAEHVPALEAAGDDRRAATAALGGAEALARDAVGRMGRLLGILRELEVAPEPVPTVAATRRRALRLRATLAPWLLLALFGTAEQLLLPERPAAIGPGTVVGSPAYPAVVVLALCWLTPLPLVLRRRAPLIAIAAIGAVLVARTAADDCRR